ncbi:MAG: helix-turn-helix domain-containing protein [Bacillota bacterium]|jgi:transcriptional regulator with XRE-family HTH domain|uniref:helix-turn-helix domain-containing protein n=1 Tax=Fictibacillus TaxID=1329200 RepID=UPI0018CD3CEF|nr:MULTISPECIES: helix-turn-helix transcriptional regulator [unclassified Fictibacillus]MBH0157123.1 helix-turn-helix transcriptional regulator [Fictibacillus sp. 5RED26]MBH0159445.1 helix-turn-helix transcriptional regulator [Fictibacillus sp. 26RED30]MBH0163757.1 helix-turn-helix transcriptional regulator [Fictibacillus sp. 7GRE50]MBH0169618.1 helix-turn-helix transcriptional regulator [Fictibacillus sp. 18YEL24]MBH0174117.1 helix-turn-helix transcriptional regulator [Fictibacillus sp. 23RED
MNEERKKVIGLRIKKCRQDNKLSQEELAQKLDMKRSNVANYEAGRVVPPGSALLEMSEIFNVTTDYLLGSTNDPYSKFSLEDNDLKQIQRQRNKLTGKDRERFENMIKMLKLSFLDTENEEGDEFDEEDDL